MFNDRCGHLRTADGTDSWQAEILLSHGENRITVTAYDQAGNRSTDTITVRFECFATMEFLKEILAQKPWSRLPNPSRGLPLRDAPPDELQGPLRRLTDPEVLVVQQ